MTDSLEAYPRCLEPAAAPFDPVELARQTEGIVCRGDSRKSTSFLKCRGADSGCTGVWHTRHAMPLDPTTRAVLEVVHQGGYTTTVIKHAGYVTFQMAEVAVPRDLFAAILERVQRFGVPPPLVQRG